MDDAMAAKIARSDCKSFTLGIIRGDEPSRELFGSNPFFYGKTRFLRPAKKLDIKDPGKSSPCLFGFYVDFLEDTLSTIDEDHGLKGIVDSFDDDLPTFKSSKNDLELVFIQFLLTNNSISILSLNRGKFLLSAIFQNPISGNRIRSRKIIALRQTDIILDVVFVLASFYKEKRVGFVPGNSKS
jgi:hypothetical protein